MKWQPIRYLRERNLAAASSFRIGLGFKLISWTILAVFVVGTAIHVYYQRRLGDELVRRHLDHLETTVRFLEYYGKARFQSGTPDTEDLRLLLAPLLDSPEFRFLEVRGRDGHVVFRQVADPHTGAWLDEWTPPSHLKRQRGLVTIGEERVVYVAVPFVGPKEEIVPEDVLDIESLFGNVGAEPGPSPEESKAQAEREELKAWLIVGSGTRGMFAELREIRLSSIFYSLPIVLAVLLLIYLAVRWTIRPLAELTVFAQRLSEGHFDQRAEVHSEDEIGNLARAFNRMAEQLHYLFRQIQQAIDKLSEGSNRVAAAAHDVEEGSLKQSTAIEEVGTSVEEMNRAIQQITANIQFLEENAVESSSSILQMSTTIKGVDDAMEFLSQSVEGTVTNINQLTELLADVQASIQSLQQAAQETASSMHQVDANIRSIRDSTQEATILAQSVVDDAQRGRSAVGRTKDGIQEIQKFASEMEAVIGDLVETSDHIVKIVDVIREIADQTNLLALNAAIIAAQAGERGRGFSVVAQEIKALSDKTALSIQEIAKLVDEVRTQSRRAGDAMRTSREAIKVGAERAEEAGTALEAILDSTEKMMNQVTAIEQATVEQSKGSHQVYGSVQQVAQMVAQLAENAQAQGEQAEALREAASRMANIAQQVRRTTREQKASSELITRSIQRITEMVQEISRSLEEQKEGSDRVMNHTEQIRVTAKENLQHVSQLAEVVRLLNEEVDRFQRLFRALEAKE